MKKLTVAFLMVFFGAFAVTAQDFKKVRDALTIAESLPKSAVSKLEEAKAGIDKLVEDPKLNTKAETFLIRAEVYGAISGNEVLKNKYPSAYLDGYLDFEKYRQMDASQEIVKKPEYSGVRSIFNIYTGLRIAGGDFFGKKNWDSALFSFDRAAQLGEAFTEYKWWKVTFDTSSYLYAGYSAQNGQKYDKAIIYYKKIADNGIVGNDYEAVYEFIPTYYYTNKDSELFQKYLAISKAAYPKNPTWAPLEFEGESLTMSPEDMVKKFDSQDAAKTLTENGYADYADYFHSNKKIKEMDAPTKKPFSMKSAYAFYKIYEIDPNKLGALYNAGVIYTLLQQDAIDAVGLYKGATPDMKAKRESAYKEADEMADKAIGFLEQAFEKLTAKASKEREDEVNLKNAARNLSSLFEYKRERTKANGKTADYDKYNTKFKFYDTKY